MKKNFLLLFAITIFSFSLTAGEKLTFAYEDGEQAPYYLGKGAKIPAKPGVSIDLLRMMEKDLGVEITFKRMPWKRCLSSLEAGEVDGIFNASFKEKRMKFGQYPMTGKKPDAAKRLTTISYALYRMKGSKVDFDGKKILNADGKVAAPSGYSIIDKLKKKYGVKVDDGSKTTPQNFEKMLAGRVVAAADQEMPGDAVLEGSAKYSDKIEKIPTLLVTKPYYLMLSHQFIKKHPELAKKIWAKVAELRDSKIKELFKKYSK